METLDAKAVGRTKALIYTCLFFGLALSISANVAWALADSVGPVPYLKLAFSAAWPLMLLGAVELIALPIWPPGPLWFVCRWAGLGVVALVMAFTSYVHMRALLASYDERWGVAAFAPLAVDGFMVIASAARIALRSRIPVVVEEPTDTKSDERPEVDEPPVDKKPVSAPVPRPKPVPAPQVPSARGMTPAEREAREEAVLDSLMPQARAAWDQLGDRASGSQLIKALGINSQRGGKLANRLRAEDAERARVVSEGQEESNGSVVVS